MTWGANSSMVFPITRRMSLVVKRSTNKTSWLAFCVAAATQPNPMGKVGILISSRLAEMKRTRIRICSVSNCHPIQTDTPDNLALLNYYLNNHLSLNPCPVKCLPDEMRSLCHRGFQRKTSAADLCASGAFIHLSPQHSVLKF